MGEIRSFLGIQVKPSQVTCAYHKDLTTSAATTNSESQVIGRNNSSDSLLTRQQLQHKVFHQTIPTTASRSPPSFHNYPFNETSLHHKLADPYDNHVTSPLQLATHNSLAPSPSRSLDILHRSNLSRHSSYSFYSTVSTITKYNNSTNLYPFTIRPGGVSGFALLSIVT